MKHFCLLWLLIGLSPVCVLAQAPIVFETLPATLQLYPRNASNEAEVPVVGTLTSPAYARVSVVVLREGQRWKYATQSPAFVNGRAAFRIPVTIRAEAAEYTFRVFISNGTDSVLVAERQRIVCGDVYVLYGQSNAGALAGIDWYDIDDRLLRNIAIPYQSANPRTEISWYASRQPFGTVGVLGLEIQKLILKNHGIPTCLINGSEGGASITLLTQRDSVGLGTIYDKLLFRTKWGGLLKSVKGIIFKQGEHEAGGFPAGYDAKFKTFHDQLRRDYGAAPRLYVGQVNILEYPVEGAGELRDFQRRTKQLYPNLETIATVGATGYDGLHYSREGNIQIALEQYRQIARDFYGATNTDQINSPDVRKVFFNARRDSITLVFDADQQVRFPKDTVYYDFMRGTETRVPMARYLYTDGLSGLVTGGRAEGQRVILGLKPGVTPGTIPAKTLTYLPSFFPVDAAFNQYNGPHLTNGKGLRAFSFYNVPIADALPGILTLQVRAGAVPGQIVLTWPGPGVPVLIERAIGSPIAGSPINFQPLATVAERITSYVDAALPNPSATYYYRVRTNSTTAEGDYSPVASVAVSGTGSIVTIPAPPTNLIAGASSPTSITLSWQDTATDETGYEVERAVAGAAFVRVSNLGPNSASYTASNLTENTLYAFRVRVINAAGASAYSNSTSATTPYSLPAAPTSLTAGATSPNSIALTWQDVAINETGYQVERSTAGSSFTIIASLPVNSTVFSGTGLIENTAYAFRVRAINPAGASPYSNTATVTTPYSLPNAPNGLTALPVTTTSVALTWQDIAFNETSYDIERSTGAGSFSVVASLPPGSTSFVSAGLAEGTAYTFRVRAVNPAGASPYSNPATSFPLILGIELPIAVDLYPNPLSDTRTLTVEAQSQTITGLVLYNGTGRLVRQWQGLPVSKTYWSLSGVSAGLYIVEIHTTGNQIVRRKLLIN